jgi:hypothetical protein
VNKTKTNVSSRLIADVKRDGKEAGESKQLNHCQCHQKITAGRQFGKGNMETPKAANKRTSAMLTLHV